MDVQKPYVITIVGPESSGKTTLASQLAASFGCPWVPEYARKYLTALDRPYSEDDLGIISARQWELISEVVNYLSTFGAQQTASKIRRPADGQMLSRKSSTDIYDIHILPLLKEDDVLLGRKSQNPDLPGARFSFINDHIDEIKGKPVIILDSGMLTLRMWARIKFGITIPLVEEVLDRDVTSLYLLCRPFVEWEPDPLREAPTVLERSWIYNQYLKELLHNNRPMQIINAKEFLG